MQNMLSIRMYRLIHLQFVQIPVALLMAFPTSSSLMIRTNLLSSVAKMAARQSG